jgi:hypothetical protein
VLSGGNGDSLADDTIKEYPTSRDTDALDDADHHCRLEIIGAGSLELGRHALAALAVPIAECHARALGRRNA